MVTEFAYDHSYKLFTFLFEDQITSKRIKIKFLHSILVQDAKSLMLAPSRLLGEQCAVVDPTVTELY